MAALEGPKALPHHLANLIAHGDLFPAKPAMSGASAQVKVSKPSAIAAFLRPESDGGDHGPSPTAAPSPGAKRGPSSPSENFLELTTTL